MRLTMHSRDGLFKKNLKGYCQEKLTRPIERHRLDDDATRLDGGDLFPGLALDLAPVWDV